MTCGMSFMLPKTEMTECLYQQQMIVLSVQANVSAHLEGNRHENINREVHCRMRNPFASQAQPSFVLVVTNYLIVYQCFGSEVDISHDFRPLMEFSGETQ